jgi:hypothetical protein
MTNSEIRAPLSHREIACARSESEFVASGRRERTELGRAIQAAMLVNSDSRPCSDGEGSPCHTI